MLRVRCLAALLIGSTASAQPSDSPLPSLLTLDGALGQFRQRGFDLLLAEAEVQRAEGEVRSAGAIPNPTVGGGFYRSFFDDNLFESHYGWSASLGDSGALSDLLSGKRALRVAVAERALATARLHRFDAQRNLEFQVKQQYFQTVLARRSLDFAREVQQRMNEYLELTKKRLAGGAISEADAARVEIDKLGADQSVDITEQTLHNSRFALAFLIGVRSLVPDFDVDPGRIDYSMPTTLTSVSPASLLAIALQHRPDLQAQLQERARADQTVLLAQRQRLPGFGLDLGFAAQGTPSGTAGRPIPTVDASGQPLPGGPFIPTTAQPALPPTLQLTLTTALPLFYQQQGEIRQAEADRRTQTVLQSKLLAQIASEVQTAYQNFRSLQARVQRMESRLLERAQTALDKVLLQRSQGQVSGLDVTIARRTYIATRLEYLQDLANYWIAVSQLEQAVGQELR